MKLNQLYTSILEEGISPVVYHTTTFYGALKILTSNRFNLSPAHDTDSEYKITKKGFYMSTSRSKLNPFSTEGFIMGVVTFTLDGRRLGNNLYGKGVDFFGGEGYRRDKSNREYEYEDRITSNHPVINNFLDYVMEVSIHVRGSDVFSNGEISEKIKNDIHFILKIAEICKRKNIRFGLYNSPQNFSLSKNPIDVNILIHNSNVASISKEEKESKFYSTHEQDVSRFQSFIHLITVMEGKIYRGRSDRQTMNEMRSLIRSNPNGVYIEIVKLLRKREFLNHPAIREHISYLMKRIKVSGMTSDVYLRRKIRELSEKINEHQ